MDEREKHSEDLNPPKKKLWHSIVALFTAVLLFIGSFQGYFYLIRPEPDNVPSLEAVKDLFDIESGQAFTTHNVDEIAEVIEGSRTDMKKIANFIAAQSCAQPDRVCQSKAIYYFVRDEIEYVPDDQFHDQLENPLWVLKTGGADCEDMAVLLMALEKAIGNGTRLVYVPGHAYAQISIPDYKGEKWINLEGTCDQCKFGELPTQTGIQKKEYMTI